MHALIGEHSMWRCRRMAGVVMCHERASQKREANTARIGIHRKHIRTDDADPHSGYEIHENEVANRSLCFVAASIELSVHHPVAAAIAGAIAGYGQFGWPMLGMPMNPNDKLYPGLSRRNRSAERRVERGRGSRGRTTGSQDDYKKKNR